jgi:hypothetical protein
MSSAIGGPSGRSFDLPTDHDATADAPPAADDAAPAATVSRIPATAPLAPPAPPAPYGTITLAGATIPREAPAPTPVTALQSDALGAIRKGLLTVPPGFKNWRSPEEAQRVADLPPVKGADGKPLSFGDLAIIRPGGTNITPGAAFLYRVAEHAGKTVVAYQNMSDPSLNDVHPIDTYDGVPVPDSLKGKIFAVGSPAPCAIAYDQASDEFIEALDVMHRDQAKLGVDPLTAKATVLANSEGTLEVPMTRSRLEKNGFPDAIGKFVAISGGANAGEVRDSLAAVQVAGRLTAVLGDALGPDAVDWHRYMDVLNRDDIQARFTPDMKRMTDLSVSSVIGPGSATLGFFDAKNNIRPGMRAAAIFNNIGDLFSKPITDWTLHDIKNTLTGGSNKSDGLLTTGMGALAEKQIIAKTPHDHAGMIEDPEIVDEILRALPKRQ